MRRLPRPLTLCTPLCAPLCGAVALLSLAACTEPQADDGYTSSPATVDTGDTDAPDDTDDTDDTCESDADCEGDPDGPVCDEADGNCYPECEPGDTGECYDGPPGTLGVGPCAGGTRTCQDMAEAAGTWGPCLGQSTPGDEICDNDIDENCDGSLLDEDQDGDGWGTCDGDCCDEEIVGCVDAHLVNPGAFEVPDNGVDDDCDGMTDELEPSCDGGLDSDSGDGFDYAAAIDLCQTTTENPPMAERTWGVIAAELTLANGELVDLDMNMLDPAQHSIRPSFGDGISPSGGDSLAVFSSGHAAAPGQTSPDFASFEGGQNLGTEVPAPMDWLLENGNVFPTSCEGAPPAPDTLANDSVMLTLRVRVPTNARSFTTRMFFFTAEYPEWVCSEFNDFFVTLIDSQADNPADKNIAIYDDGQDLWPVGLNILTTAPGLFRVCESGTVGCQGDLPEQQYNCPDGPGLLAGTGFDAIDGFNSCNGNNFPVGGGTGWLEMSGNVEPGETIDVRFAIWDTGGHIFDALVLLDDWRWSLDAASPGVIVP